MTASGFAMSESAFPGGMQPWSSLVIDRDTSICDPQICRYCDQPVGCPHADVSGKRCSRLTSRLRMRIGVIANLHLKGRHDLTEAEFACKCFDYRDALIEDLRGHDMLDREMFMEEAGRQARSVDDAVRHRAQWMHLDKGWDGKGFRPSYSAAIRDCIERTGGLPPSWKAAAADQGGEAHAQ